MKNNLTKLLSIISIMFLQVQSVLAETANNTAEKTSELSFVMQKFGFTIMITVVCIVAIITLLIIYKKITQRGYQTLKYGERDLSLETPTNIDDAIKHFLEKTKPDTEN